MLSGMGEQSVRLEIALAKPARESRRRPQCPYSVSTWAEEDGSESCQQLLQPSAGYMMIIPLLIERLVRALENVCPEESNHKGDQVHHEKLKRGNHLTLAGYTAGSVSNARTLSYFKTGNTRLLRG